MLKRSSSVILSVAGIFGAARSHRNSCFAQNDIPRELMPFNNLILIGECKELDMHLQPKKIPRLLPTDILFQTSFWGNFKSRLGWKSLAFDFLGNELEADILVLIKEMSHGCVTAHVPQGPEYYPPTDQYGPFLEALSESLKKQLDSSVALIRYDLPWPSQYDERNSAESQRDAKYYRPEIRLQELRMNIGTKLWNFRKPPIDVMSPDTVMLDIMGSEESLLSKMKPKTRYNLNYARRKGVRVFQPTVKALPEFYEIYLQTASRDGFDPCDYKHFSELFSAIDSEPNDASLLFLLSTDGHDLLAGAVVSLSKRRATYILGASSNTKRNLMGSYAVQWEVIRLARKYGCTDYDMWGAAPSEDQPHPWSGLTRFKSGFGGKIVHREGTWDYPLNLEKYEAIRHAEFIHKAKAQTIDGFS